MRIYSRTGDLGETGLIGGARARKDDLIFEVLGSLDELNGFLGVAIAQEEGLTLGAMPAAVRALLHTTQNCLFDLGSEVANPPDSGFDLRANLEGKTEALEASIDAQTRDLPELRNFILPGGSPLAAQLHLARSVCRRAERHLVRLSAETEIRPELLAYLNRLSDWLFTTARTANAVAGHPETPWKRES